MEPAETAVTRFTRGHFSELIQKDAGGEGVLFAAKHDIHGNVMVKVFKTPNKYSEQEVKTLVKVICHQNIVRLLGSFYFEDGTDDMRSGYVMEHMANGSLSAVIHDLSIPYSDSQVYSWIQQAGRGIAYLHSQNIIHRDVNTRNMLLGENNSVLKISDFGLAKPDAATTERNTCIMGTTVYMAPEVIDSKGMNFAADVYSLGISTWEMFHRKKPFYEHDSLPRYRLCEMIITGTRPKIEIRMEDEMENLILRSLQSEYKLRPKASDFTTIPVKLADVGAAYDASNEKLQIAKLPDDMLQKPEILEAKQFGQAVLDVQLPTDFEISQHFVSIGSLEALLGSSHLVHPMAALGVISYANLPETLAPCPNPATCHFQWNGIRCDCQMTNIVYLAQCLLCEAEYQKTSYSQEKYPRCLQGPNNGIYIGYVGDRVARGRFQEAVTNSRNGELLVKHWRLHNLPPPERNERRYRFIALYKGLFHLQVRAILKELFNASING